MKCNEIRSNDSLFLLFFPSLNLHSFYQLFLLHSAQKEERKKMVLTIVTIKEKERNKRNLHYTTQRN